MAEDVFELVGSKVAGTFEVDQVVAEGGFAVVYRAMHTGFRAPVALKCLKIPQRMTSERQIMFKRQFQAEAELLFKLSARLPNVVRPLHVDAMTAPNGRFMPFLALEWLQGETLEARASRLFDEGRGMGTLEELVTLLSPVAEALETAHCFEDEKETISIVHRDIKPENLFIAEIGGQQVVKVLDFGIGKAKSVAGQIAGKASSEGISLQSFTPAFGAPEQWVPKRFGQTGPWTDVYSLALSLVELFVGRPIMDGDQGAMMGAALDTTRRPTPRNEGVEVSPAVEAAFEKALAVDPRARTQSVGVFWSELCAALGLAAGASQSLPDQTTEALPRRRRSHDELDLGSSGPLSSLELASLPPRRGLSAEVQSTQTAVAHGPLGSAVARTELDPADSRPRNSPQLAALPRVTVRPPLGPFWRELLVPGAAITGGLMLAVLGQQYAAASGQVFTIASVGLSWITTPMVVLGGAVGLARFLLSRQR